MSKSDKMDKGDIDKQLADFCDLLFKFPSSVRVGNFNGLTAISVVQKDVYDEVVRQRVVKTVKVFWSDKVGVDYSAVISKDAPIPQEFITFYEKYGSNLSSLLQRQVQDVAENIIEIASRGHLLSGQYSCFNRDQKVEIHVQEFHKNNGTIAVYNSTSDDRKVLENICFNAGSGFFKICFVNKDHEPSNQINALNKLCGQVPQDVAGIDRWINGKGEGADERGDDDVGYASLPNLVRGQQNPQNPQNQVIPAAAGAVLGNNAQGVPAQGGGAAAGADRGGGAR